MAGHSEIQWLWKMIVYQSPVVGLLNPTFKVFDQGQRVGGNELHL
jgi:hypothetical protein